MGAARVGPVRNLGSGWRRLWSGALPWLGVFVACGSPPREHPAAGRVPAGVSQGRGDPARPAPASLPDDPVLVGAAAPFVAATPPTLSAETLAAAPPPDGEPPDLTALKARILHGDSSTRALKSLQTLGGKYQKNEEIPYLLGQLYFEKLWVGDGLKSFRRAIALNPLLGANPYVIRAAIGGLGNDRDHSQVSRFLVQDIGKPAAPYLEEVLYGDWRQQVKERAAAILRELQ